MDNPIPEKIKIKSWKKVLGFPLSKRRSIMDRSQAEEFFGKARWAAEGKESGAVVKVRLQICFVCFSKNLC